MNPRPIAYKAIALPLSYRGLELFIDQHTVVLSNLLTFRSFPFVVHMSVIRPSTQGAPANLVDDIIVGGEIPNASILIKKPIRMPNFFKHLLPIFSWGKVALSVAMVVHFLWTLFPRKTSEVILMRVRSAHIAIPSSVAGGGIEPPTSGL